MTGVSVPTKQMSKRWEWCTGANELPLPSFLYLCPSHSHLQPYCMCLTLVLWNIKPPGLLDLWPYSRLWWALGNPWASIVDLCTRHAASHRFCLCWLVGYQDLHIIINGMYYEINGTCLKCMCMLIGTTARCVLLCALASGSWCRT